MLSLLRSGASFLASLGVDRHPDRSADDAKISIIPFLTIFPFACSTFYNVSIASICCVFSDLVLRFCLHSEVACISALIPLKAQYLTDVLQSLQPSPLALALKSRNTLKVSHYVFSTDSAQKEARRLTGLKE